MTHDIGDAIIQFIFNLHVEHVLLYHSLYYLKM